jgi:UDP-N-acetylmuramyl tripeptide synthase
LWKSALPGLYNRYNTLAAVATAKSLNIDDNAIRESLSSFTPAFGRQEEFVIDGKKVKIFLSKNPAGFNASLRTVIEQKAKHFLFVLNDRIPDGRDISWIWDVDFETIPKGTKTFVGGDRMYDLALRLKYAGIESELTKTVSDALQAVSRGETLYILPTYSAMLEVRKILIGRKIL